MTRIHDKNSWRRLAAWAPLAVVLIVVPISGDAAGEKKKPDAAAEKRAVAADDFALDYFLALGALHERGGEWPRARLAYAQALVLSNAPEVRAKLYRAVTTPKVAARPLYTAKDDKVFTAVFGAGGGRLIEVCPTQIKIREAATGKEQNSIALEQPEDELTPGTAFLSPDRKLLAAQTTSQTLMVWDLSKAALRFSLPLPEGAGPPAFSPDSKLIAVPAAEQGIKIVDAASGKELKKISGLPNFILNLAFTPDGKKLIVSDLGGPEDNDGKKKARIVDVAAGKVTKIYSLDPLRDEEETTTAISPDAKFMATIQDGAQVKLWGLDDGKNVHSFAHDSYIGQISFSPSGKLIATGAETGLVQVWETDSGKRLIALPTRAGSIAALEFSPDEKLLATGGGRTIQLLDIEAGAIAFVWDAGLEFVEALAFSPDQKRLVAVNATDNVAKVFALETANAAKSFKQDQVLGPIDGLGYSPDGKTIARIGSNQAAIVDPTTGKVRKSWKAHDDLITAIAYAPDGKGLYTASPDHLARLWDPASGKKLREFAGHQEPVIGLAVSPDGKLLATGGFDKSVKLWDPASGKLIRSSDDLPAAVERLAFNPEGDLLAVGFKTGEILLLRAADGTPAGSLKGHTETISALVFSPDGKALASASYDATIRLWNPESGGAKLTLGPRETTPMALAFTKDGRALIAGADDGTIDFLDLPSGKPLLKLKAQPNGIMALAVSPDGATLAAGGLDRVLMLFPLLNDLIHGAPADLLAATERDTGLKLKGKDIFNWDPAANQIAETPLARPY